jgi:hypothetical protein
MSANKNTTEQKKALFLEALKRNLNVVTAACETTGVGRTAFYRWCNEDPVFKAKVDELPEIQIDFVETQLLKKIKEGSDQAIIFYLKTKGKKRGYQSNIDITSEGKSITEIKLIEIKRIDNGDGIKD